METAEIMELISAFVPEEILRDFELKEVKKGVRSLPTLYGREGRREPLIPLSRRRRKRWFYAAI